MLLLTSCKINLPNIRAIQLSSLTNEEGTKINQMSNDIIQCFVKKDKNALKKMFCKKTQNDYNFQDEIDKAFTYLACDDYITSQIDTTASGGDSTEFGERVSWYVIPNIPYIEVLQADVNNPDSMVERYFSIQYYWQITNNSDKSLEGLQYLTIKLLNMDSSVTIGKEVS